MKWLQKRQKKVFLGLAVVLTGGLVLTSLGTDFLGTSPLDAAAIVNGRKITRQRVDRLVDRILTDQRNNPQAQTPEARDYIRRQVIQSLVQEEVFVQEAERYGLRVSDSELAQYIQANPGFQKDGRFDMAAYGRFLSGIRMSVPDFEAEQRRQILAQKVQFLMTTGVKVSPLEFARRKDRALAEADPQKKASILSDPSEFRNEVQRSEMQASLQEWYNGLTPRLKVKVLLTPSPTPPSRAG